MPLPSDFLIRHLGKSGDLRDLEPNDLLFKAVIAPGRDATTKYIHAVIGLMGGFALVLGVGFWLSGAWPVSGFLGGEIFLLYLALAYHHGNKNAREELALDGRRLMLSRIGPEKARMPAKCPPGGCGSSSELGRRPGSSGLAPWRPPNFLWRIAERSGTPGLGPRDSFRLGPDTHPIHESPIARFGSPSMIAHGTVQIAGRPRHTVSISEYSWLEIMEPTVRKHVNQAVDNWTTNYDRMAAAIDYVVAHRETQPSLERIAKAVNLSPFIFSVFFPIGRD